MSNSTNQIHIKNQLSQENKDKLNELLIKNKERSLLNSRNTLDVEMQKSVIRPDVITSDVRNIIDDINLLMSSPKLIEAITKSFSENVNNPYENFWKALGDAGISREEAEEFAELINLKEQDKITINSGSINEQELTYYELSRKSISFLKNLIKEAYIKGGTAEAESIINFIDPSLYMTLQNYLDKLEKEDEESKKQQQKKYFPKEEEEGTAIFETSLMIFGIIFAQAVKNEHISHNLNCAAMDFCLNQISIADIADIVVQDKLDNFTKNIINPKKIYEKVNGDNKKILEEENNKELDVNKILELIDVLNSIAEESKEIAEEEAKKIQSAFRKFSNKKSQNNEKSDIKTNEDMLEKGSQVEEQQAIDQNFQSGLKNNKPNNKRRRRSASGGSDNKSKPTDRENKNMSNKWQNVVTEQKKSQNNPTQTR